jgi:hypothetical protein
VLFLVLVGVVLGVMLGGLVAVMRGVQAVRVGEVGVMPGLVVIAVLVVLRGFAVMLGGFLVVFGRGLVMRAALVRLCHVVLLVLKNGLATCADPLDGGVMSWCQFDLTMVAARALTASGNAAARRATVSRWTTVSVVVAAISSVSTLRITCVNWIERSFTAITAE